VSAAPLTSAIRPMAPAKLRILETADSLFTTEGIRTVGIDRLIGESRVTKATFYKHYGSKDRLIREYMTYRHARQVEQLAAREDAGAEGVLRAVLALTVAEISGSGFRGCAFLNAAAEFPEQDHPVRAIVRDHREWLGEELYEALRGLGHPLPGEAADDLVLARDGAMSGAYAGDSIAATTALTRAFDRAIGDAARR
jgi:AcrR family transcriptional regulator